jgi:hypothetical protein
LSLLSTILREKVHCQQCCGCGPDWLVHDPIQRREWMIIVLQDDQLVDQQRLDQLVKQSRRIEMRMLVFTFTCAHAHMLTCSHVHIHMLNSCQSLKHRTGIENSRLAIIRPQLFGVKCTKIHEDAPAKITLTRAHPQMCTKSRAFV